MSAAVKFSEEVNLYLRGVDKPTLEVLDFLREVFLSSDADVKERIKWNSPSFYFSGPMKDFDPKEYRRDLAVINLHRGRILVVFPSGAKIDSDILEGQDYSDGRKIVEIPSLDHARKLAPKLQQGVKDWISKRDI